MKLLSYKINEIKENEGNIVVEFTFDTEKITETIHYAHTSHGELREIEGKVVEVLLKHSLFDKDDEESIHSAITNYAQAYINGRLEEQEKVTDTMEKLVDQERKIE